VSDDDPAARLPSRMIGKKRQRAGKLRDLYIRQAVDNNVSDDLIKELASVCLEYWSCLREFRDEPAVDDDDFPDVAPIRKRLGRETRTLTKSTGTWDRNLTYERGPAVLELDPEYLIEVTHALDDLSQQLGFGAAAAQEVDVFGVDTDAERDP
jgi:hypothetical protein